MAIKNYSADYKYLDYALRASWDVWQQLESEMDSFVPKPEENFREAKDAEIERLQILNPKSARETLAERVDQQFELISSAEWQFRERFEWRRMSLYVTVVLLSHALCEALINAALALGLAEADAADLFPALENVDFKVKWIVGPRTFVPHYRFPAGTALDETLGKLAKQRNALVHQKIDLRIEGKTILEGAEFSNSLPENMHAWLHRFFSLPYGLHELLGLTCGPSAIFLFWDRTPITVAPAHNAALKRLQRPASGARS